MSERKIVITCEHGGNEIPPEWRYLFHEAEETLTGHEGYDPGTLDMGRCLADRLQAKFHYTTMSRLLVDCNRSLHHPKLFSRFTKELPWQEKQRILSEYYQPYRNRVEKTVSRIIGKGGGTLHFSVHSFTPILHGKTRNSDIGLLYDPTRKPEKDFCLAWQQEFKKRHPDLRVRRNYPYRGKADGFTTALRKKFGTRDYLGIELEINQRLILDADENSFMKLIIALFDMLHQAQEIFEG